MSDPTTHPTVPLSLGATVGDYRITKVLGKERIGAFYLAQGKDGERAFLRLVDPAVADSTQFEAVEETLSRLQGIVHRNVTELIGGAEVDEGFYYVLKAAGTTLLFDLMYSGRSLYERELVWLGRGLSAGLAALHGAGVMHGALTPNQVLVTHHGPIVIDVGWTDRLSETRLGRAEARLKDLRALRDTLLFAATPRSGKSPSLSRAVVDLLDELQDDETLDAAKVAKHWRDAAKELGLPDPMAPDSLRALLSLHEERSAEPSSDELAPLQHAPLDLSGEGEGLLFHSTEGPILPPVLSREPSADEPDETESDAAMSAVAYAKGILAEFPVEPLSAERKPLPKAKEPKRAAAKAKSSNGKPAKTKSGAKHKRATGKTKRAKVQPKGKKNCESGLGPPLGRFGLYTLVEEVSAGRASTVYRATRADLDRPLAIKVIVPGALSEKALPRFMRAAEAAEGLAHPVIAGSIDSGVEGAKAWPYVASHYVEGRPLSELCRAESAQRGDLPLVLLDVLRAVEHAHTRGVVHGDLKPENIVVTAKGEARVLEFGIPRPESPGGKPATPGPYSAPEVRLGQPPTEASDTYSLGMVLYTVATKGRLPEEASGLAHAIGGDPPPPSCLDDSVPWQIDAITHRALQPAPGDRYTSTGEMGDDLQRCVMGALTASPASLPRRLALLAYRQPIAAGLTLLVTALALALAITKGPSWVAALRTPVATATPPPATDTDTGDSAALAALESAKTRLENTLTTEREAMHAAKREWDQKAKTRASQLLLLGHTLLAEGMPLEAKQAYAESKALSPSQEAEEGIANAEVRLAAPPEEKPPEAPVRRESPDAHLALGRQHLAANRNEQARASLRKALALGASEAAPLLTQAERAIFTKETKARDDGLFAKEAAEAARLARQAAQYKARGAVTSATKAYIDALAMDPENAAARAGLLALSKPRPTRPAPSGDAQALARERSAARQALSRARDLHKKRGDRAELYAAYLLALKSLDRATVLDPKNAPVLRDRAGLAREFAGVLREDGQTAFADGILTSNGLAPAAKPKPAAKALDPYLVIVESDEVSARRAFGGSVSFAPTDDAFAELRTWIKEQGERFRVVLYVRSKVQTGSPTAILATGLWLRLHDKVSKTKSAPVKIEFAGGPHKRLVRVGSEGRVVLPFTRIHVLRKTYVPEATAAAKKLLAETKARVEAAEKKKG